MSLPAGWGFLPHRVPPKPRKGYRRDWPSVQAAIAALTASGYAQAQGTDRRKLADIMRTFDLDMAAAFRCLQVARGAKTQGGRGWKRTGWDLSTAFPQTYSLGVKTLM